MMKNIQKIIIEMGARWIAVSLFIVLILGLQQVGEAQDSQSTTMGQLWIHRLEGEALIQVEGNDEWASAAINFPLQKGDRIWTTQGAMVQINHFGGSSIHLREQTLVEIVDFLKPGNQDHLRLALSMGKLYADISGDATSRLTVDVDTPNLSVRAEPATTLQVESIEQENSTHVTVIKGEALVQTEGSSSRLEAGRTMIAKGNDSIENGPMASIETPDSLAETPSPPPPDYSENNNREYVPEPLQRYTYELDAYGYWTYVNDYGRVWVPTAVPAGWAPFHHGKTALRLGFLLAVGMGPVPLRQVELFGGSGLVLDPSFSALFLLVPRGRGMVADRF